jgi:hypothetical protein
VGNDVRSGSIRDRPVQRKYPSDVRFSERPFEVKHFQAIHHCSVDVGLALPFGIGTRVLV